MFKNKRNGEMKEIKGKLFFNLKEAEYIKNYYSDKVVGLIPYDNIKMKIDTIEIVSVNKMYRVMCVGHSMKQPHVTTEIYIEDALERLNLESLHEVLKREGL